MNDVGTVLEMQLAALLRRGTWLASIMIAVGLLLSGVSWSVGGFQADSIMISAGIALFIALPVARVALMGVSFARERDIRFALISALVLATILIGCMIGLLLPGASIS